ncbi:glucose-6-phosphate isomerase [Aquiluna borgnonia]|uniref:Glucose-6-phosphate isomerase n=1 Tax=Aquiluna borgnonia TaxID=2499157 RepID=A0A7D4U7S1_9MICO|nr:glucose-6-phosphate isomerase [Aquiluna borgnonia]QKJ25316.1 glucose-6-phosphate isomerase [Aquiluna borgnonia]
MKFELATRNHAALTAVVESLVEQNIASRIAAKDHTLWGPAAESEASIRLGWVTSAQDSVALIPEILELRDEFRNQGISRFVLCGMGGSSLAPEVITKTAGVELVVLDSTAPDQVAAALTSLEKTAVVVSSKSGSTVETDSQKRAFETAFRANGISPTDRIVIVTDPGSPLDQASREAGYRVFNADPNVGGRYSALTAFGIVPSGLAGADIAGLLAAAQQISSTLGSDSLDNPGLWLGALLAKTPSPQGFKDKFLIETDQLGGFGDWAEQLVAESTGKEQKGVLPVVVTKSAPELANIPADTLSISFAAEISGSEDAAFEGSLGELFLLWEYATVIAGYLQGINPFDQPNVESAKIAARALLDSPVAAKAADFAVEGVAVTSYGFDVQGDTLAAAVQSLLDKVGEQSYISVHTYLNRAEYPQFEQLRDLLAKVSGRPVTFGWGPRFLHSTGQYHKGGPRQGVFLQITGEHGHDLEIEGRPFTFGTLIAAQAAGDAQVLLDNNLPVLSLRFSEPLSGLEQLKKVLG